MNETEGRKNKIQGVSLSPELLVHAKSQAESQHGGNLSRYIQSLIEADMKQMAKSPVAQPLTAKYFIADATKLLLPEFIEDAEPLIRGRDQAEVMRSVLKGLFLLLQREDRLRDLEYGAANLPLKRFAVIPAFDAYQIATEWEGGVREVCREEIYEEVAKQEEAEERHFAEEQEADAHYYEWLKEHDPVRYAELSGEPASELPSAQGLHGEPKKPVRTKPTRHEGGKSVRPSEGGAQLPPVKGLAGTPIRQNRKSGAGRPGRTTTV